MSRFFAHILNSTWKEVLLLSRDKGGLFVLFLMPATLVVIVTLVQENVMELTGEKSSEILFVDQDKGHFSEKLREILESSDRIKLIASSASRADSISMVEKGDYQVCIIVPKGSSDQLTARTNSLFDSGEQNQTDFMIPVYFDPSVLPGFRSGIMAVMQLTVVEIEMESKVKALETKITELLAPIGSYGMDIKDDVQQANFDNLQKNLLTIEEKLAGKQIDTAPSAVHHNIPAWALFGLFFTCIPLAGSLLIERKSGIWIRLLSQPVSPASLLIGKIICYVMVCFCQIGVIVLIGRYLFPLLGLPAFVISGDIPSLITVSVACSLAACGYGVFLGSICNSMEQASMFGSISIVIAAALGGTLVPTYAMPGVMQRISAYSPLNWGLSSYQDVLMRGFTFSQIQLNILKLLVFFTILLLLSWQLNRHSK